MKKDSLKINVKESDMDTFFTVVFYYVDEIYQKIKPYLERPGPEPAFTDSEVITINIVGQMCSDSENAWHSFVRKNFGYLFPLLIERSRYHRRCKCLQQATELLRQVLSQRLGVGSEEWHILDSMPVPVCRYARAGRSFHFSEQFCVDHDRLYGHCASKGEKYYGFKLHLMVTFQGIPAHYVLAPASHHDVELAPEVLGSYRPGIGVGMDKGYVGLSKRLAFPEKYRLIVQPRKNQKVQLTKEEKNYLYRYRSVVETCNGILAGQFNLQFSRAKSAWGLTSRVAAKLASLTMAIYINHLLGEPLLHIKELIF